ncbi:MAG: hypothetical protein JEZ04_21355 [Spirochaetales bacterium]|nr:hypothetical protein [Spirochaetales bacterium]
MKGLLKILPPLSPDYAGASSALYTLGGAIIINGADGCIGNVTGYDEPRFFDYNTHIYSSGLREVKAITGDEEILKEKIDNSVGDKDVSFITILGTPNSAVIASDHKGVANILRRGQRIPVFTINTTGILTYEKGASNAFLELAKNFIEDRPTGSGVNIIGASPMDYWGEAQIKSIKRAIENRGLQVNGIWGADNSLESIRKALMSEVNLVVSYSGLKAARYMKKKYGIPYIAGVPAGRQFSDHLVEMLKSPESEVPVVPEVQPSTQRGVKRALIIGDQIWSMSIKAYLGLEKEITDVYTASFFSLDPVYRSETDLIIDSEKQLKQLISRLKPDLIIGDPLCEGFIEKSSPSSDIEFIGIPHPAVSSRLHWDHDIVYAGEELSF